MKTITTLLFLILPFLMFAENATKKDSKEKEIKAILKRIKAPRFPENSFVITDFGNSQQLRKNIKPALDMAINSCHSSGGGTVIIPAGDYFCKGPIHLKSNVNLHLNSGALVTFSQNPDDFLPLVFVRWEGVEIYNYSPYIYANNQENIAVTGNGKFNGNAAGGIFTWREKQKPGQNMVRKMGRDGVDVEERRFGKGHFLRPAFLQLVNCRNILISDISIENVPFWVIQPTYCKNVTVSSVKINSTNINNDGVDPDSSEDVLIDNCTFNTGDDAIAIKSGRDQDAWRVAKPSRNIIVRNCTAENTLHGMAFGSEMSGGIENVFVRNCTLKKVKNYAIQFKANKDRGGFIRNISIDNVQIGTTNTAIYFTNDYHSYSGGNSPSEFYNIEIKNVTCNTAKQTAFDMVGLEEKPIHDILFQNITIKNKVPSVAKIMKNIQLKNVVVGGAVVSDIKKLNE